MQNEAREDWMKLCEQASTEQDPKKLLILIKEINRVLEAKRVRLNKKQADEEDQGLTHSATR
jgi:hypothetical protein